MNKDWKDKTCDDCEFNIDNQCRRFPTKGYGVYPPVMMQGLTTKACAEWRQEGGSKC